MGFRVSGLGFRGSGISGLGVKGFGVWVVPRGSYAIPFGAYVLLIAYMQTPTIPKETKRNSCSVAMGFIEALILASIPSLAPSNTKEFLRSRNLINSFGDFARGSGLGVLRSLSKLPATCGSRCVLKTQIFCGFVGATKSAQPAYEEGAPPEAV